MHWTRCAIDSMSGLADQTSAIVIDAKKGGTTSWNLADRRDEKVAVTTGIIMRPYLRMVWWYSENEIVVNAALVAAAIATS